MFSINAEERIEIKIKPIRKLWHDEISSHGGYGCITEEKGKVELNSWGNFLVKGTMPELIHNFEYNAVLLKKEDKRGIYYEPISLFEDIPTDAVKQKGYLEQIISPSHVKSLYDAYPDSNIIKLIQEDQLDISKVKGVGKKVLLKIKEKIENNIEYREAFEYFGQFKITPNLIVKLVKHYKSSKLAVEKVKESPYNLLAVPGIGFKKADAIAIKMDYPMDSADRITAAIQFITEENEKDGNTYINKHDLVEKVYELIGISSKKIMETLAETEDLGVYGDCVALKSTFNSEKYVATRLKKMLEKSTELEFDVEKFITEQESKLNIKLTDQQKGLFENIKKFNVNLLIGFAGCGKSQMQKLIIDLLEELNMTYLLLAPTGKAAKIISGYTERYASTVHRVIAKQYTDDEGKKHPVPIYDDFIIIDESSMMDIKLTARLLSRVKNPNARILFVGDSFQIPSVQCGLFLHDCIESKVIPTTFLDIVFRQKEGGIMDIVTKMRLNEKFIANGETGIHEYGDNCIIASVPQDKMEGGYRYFYNQMVEKFNPEDIMVLSPTKKGKLGTYAVNSEIQEIINPHKNEDEEITYGKDPEVTFRHGDYVLNTKNSYRILNVNEQEIDIVNGDMGIIEKIDKDEKEIVVDLDFDKVPLKFGRLNQLLHSWCITLHKCITEDTWIYTNKGLMQLSKLNNNAKVGEFKILETDVEVFNGTYLEKPKSFYNNGLDEVLEIQTKRGYELKSTRKHGIDILNSHGDIVRVDSKDVTVGDVVLLSKTSEVFGNQTNLPAHWSNQDSLNVRTKKFRRPNQMNKSFARFIGFMVADGTVCKSGIRFSKRYLEVTELFRNTVYDLFGYFNEKIRLRECGDHIYEVSSIDISDFCKNIEGIQPNNKFVPECILSASKECQEEFLKAVFEDGTVNIKKGKFDHVELTMKEKVMAKQIQLILLNMGIVSTVSLRRSRQFPLYSLYIYKNDAMKFAENIGFVSKLKNDRLKLAFINAENSSSNYTIPNLRSRVEELIKKSNLKSSHFKYVSKSLHKNRFTISILKKFLFDVKKYVDVNDETYKLLKYLSSENVYLDPIKNITASKQNTYCLEMPMSHKFIQNGIHAYNSQGSGSRGVIMLLDKSHTYQLNANLIYTGATRTKDFLVILTQADVLNRALRKNANMQRDTFLKEMLLSDMGDGDES